MPKNKRLIIRKAAVLGAGVMGAQIAAHLTNSGVPTLLFDLPAKEGDPNAIANSAIERLAKLKPSPIAVTETLNLIQPANYGHDLAKLEECDLIIEAIAERLDWKQDLYSKVNPHINDNAIFVTNTSGLSITALAETLPAELQTRFLGVHFFNPPRYMRLVEMIPTAKTDKTILEQLETFLVSTLGKGVIYAKDTPNFIANRIGVFSMLATMIHAEKFNIPFEIADALTGPAIGRPKSATFRTADVVGLDTFVHVVQTMTDNLASDPWHSHYQVPTWFSALVEKGALGQKTGAGVYRKQGKIIEVLDLETQDYRPAEGRAAEEVLEILKIKNPREKFQALQSSEHPQAQFLWSCFRDVFHYSAFHLESIADNVRDVDLAIRWGFGWKQGIFETWQTAGWKEIVELLEADIAKNKTLANAELPDWVKTIDAVYGKEGAYAPAKNAMDARSKLDVYKRQLFPEAVLAESFDEGETVFENDSIRLWHQGDDIAIASFKTKGNTIDDLVLAGIMQSIDIAEQSYKGLVLWPRQGNDFSFGANLKMMMEVIKKEGTEAAGRIIDNFQKASMKLRYCQVPTVAAIKGRVLGGGCELSMHCDRIVAAFETYIGLVEVGVGLIPAGGGTKEFAMRSANVKTKQQNINLGIEFYKNIAMAAVSTSAVDARQKGFMKDTDVIVMNTDEILYVAKQQALAMYESGYRAPVKTTFPVSGKTGLAAIKALLANFAAGGFMSDYDNFLCDKIAAAFTGGTVDEGTQVDEEYMLKLERETFVEFLQQEKTQERIEYTLKTGKPLRN